VLKLIDSVSDASTVLCCCAHYWEYLPLASTTLDAPSARSQSLPRNAALETEKEAHSRDFETVLL